jgi:hypothetical protein
MLASARERTGRAARRHASACGPLTRIGFVPETIAPLRDLPRIYFAGERMTAYLISVALLGLIAIAIAEALA